MRVLVTYGSKRDGTAGIAAQIAQELREGGLAADLKPAKDLRDLRAYDAVVVGGALYAGFWHRDARRFVKQQAEALRVRPVWFFSSGPLDDSAAQKEIPPTSQVQALMRRVGARGHKTFGGRLAADAKGFPASAMAKTHAGDWRDPSQIAGWSHQVAEALLALPPEEVANTASAIARQPPAESAVSRGFLAALTLLAGVSALAGGAALVAAPDGSLVGMPLSVLNHSRSGTS